MFNKVEQKYNTIVIDPPWDISLTGSFDRRENRAKKLPYKTMPLEDVKKIPISKIANQGAHIYCWTTNKMLRNTFDVLESWGVNFHLVLVWNKPSFIAPCLAYQFATEFILLGFFGKPMQKFLGKVSVNWIKATPLRNGHSSKPDEFYNLIREMSPPPRIDIFARKSRAGFDTWGDESPSETQLPLAVGLTSSNSHNIGLKVQKSKISSPKSNPTDLTSLNHDIMFNLSRSIKEK